MSDSGRKNGQSMKQDEIKRNIISLYLSYNISAIKELCMLLGSYKIKLFFLNIPYFKVQK